MRARRRKMGEYVEDERPTINKHLARGPSKSSFIGLCLPTGEAPLQREICGRSQLKLSYERFTTPHTLSSSS